MLMRRHHHHHPESPDYYSSLASVAAASAGVTSPSLSLGGIISSSLEKMPLELRLRRSGDLLLASGRERAGALDEELSPKTECSEDSVEIRSTPTRIHRKPQIILRPNAVLASPLHSSSLKRPGGGSSSSNNCPPNKMSNWMDPQQPDEKRMRLMAGQQQQQPTPLTHFYHPATSAQHQNVLKLAGQQHQHPHELLLLEAERNRLFHHWMRPNNWPLPHVHPAAESSAAHHLMTSALHYHYPHLLQQHHHHHQGHNYNLPPHPFLHPSSPASIFNLSYGHLLPHPIFHHQQRTAAFFSTPSSDGTGKTLPPLSPVCSRSVTPPPPPPSILGPLPPLVPVGGSQSPSRIGPPPPPPPPDFNHKKMSNASGESCSPSATSLTMGKKTNKKLAIHPAGRTSQTTKESRKHPSDSGCDRKFCGGSKTADTVVVVKPPVLPLFLSVETLLSREKPAATSLAPAEKIRPEERFRHAESEEEEDEEEEIHWRSSAFTGDGPDGFQPSAASGGASMAGSTSHRNYKNMTRERRMQANARERTRVHTISSAFEALRRAVPSFSHGQRLSKLSILRVASAYIAALGQLAGDEDSTQESSAQITRDGEKDHQATTTTTTTTTGRRQLAECVDRCTRTLMTEGQLLRRNRKRSGVANGRHPSDDEDD